VKRAGFVPDAAIAVGAFLLAFGLAELFGAENLGTALTFGAIAFMAAIVGTILFRARGGAPASATAAARADAPAAPRTKAPPPPPRKRRR
jgi:hypothetical protein